MPGTYISPAETGFYYLNSRYYDPEIGRFINTDNQIAGIGGEILGCNLFAYCHNTPINYFDPTGESAEAVQNMWLSSMWWLTLIDGAFPIGDLVYLGGTAIIGAIVISSVSANVKNKSKNDSKKPDNSSKPVVEPGQLPTKDDGYIAPKKGPIKGKNKDGKVGWKDKNGNIWVPQPTGSNGAHGGGHWDVQSPKGGYVNVYPGGIIRGGKAPYPNILIFP